ncbi:hypothetical protein D1872_208830 [compost metagenome]
MAVSEVSNMGRKRALVAATTASFSSIPSRLASSINSISTMPLRTTIPAKVIKPNTPIKLTGVFRMNKPRNPPAAAIYTVVNMMSGVEKE